MKNTVTVVIAGIFVFGLSFIGAGQWQVAHADDLVIEPLADGLHAFRAGDVRSFFMIGDDGVLVVDPISADVASALRGKIYELTDKAVTHVVYSHSLNQRSPGGQVFKDEGASFVAHEQCEAHFKETPHPQVVMPDDVFSDTTTVSLGNRSLDLYDLGPHYDCSIVMITRPDNYMFVVGTVAPPGATVPTNPSTSNVLIYNLIPFLEALQALANQEGVETMIADRVMFPGMSGGEATLTDPTGSASVVSEQLTFWRTLFDAAIDARAQGIGGSVVGRFIDHTPYEDMPGYDKRKLEWITRRVQSALVTGK